MTRILLSPSKYVQGKGEMTRLAQYIFPLGQKPFVLISQSGKKRFGDLISQSLNQAAVFEIFQGECCQQEIDRVTIQFEQSGCDVLVGVGGGKIFDTIKCVSIHTGSPVAIVPTVASTDAPCSAVAVIYTPDGVPEKSAHMKRNPDVVIVDSEIIAKAPARLLVAGMGDALATFFEARACQRSYGDNSARAKTTLAATAMAQLCYETLLADGLRAKVAVEKHVCTPAVENIIEANTYLSGLGFESGGLAAAHPVHDGLSALSETHAMYHGEKVAFGTLVQLVLENAPVEETEEVVHFCQSVGLPTTLCELGLHHPTQEQIQKVAEVAVSQRCMGNLPFAVSADMIADAIWAADAIGCYYSQGECC